MKSLFLATAALAAFAAAPALAQTAPTGSIGLAWTNTDADFGGLTAEEDGGLIDGNVAGPIFGDWTVTMGASLAWADGAFDEDRPLSGQVHLTRKVGGLRAGGFVAASDAGGETLTSVGGEVQSYMGAVTLTGGVAFSTMESADAISATADVAFYPMANLRLNAGLGGGQIEFTGSNAEFYSGGVGAEYQFAGTPVSLYTAYDHTTVDDADLDIDSVSFGLRFSFGSDGLQAREQSGADLTRTVGGLAGVLSGL
ncbi:hypothetical protein GGQ87_003049 [Brevundimonas alba]|uniref:Outer membrane protein beta-barrel domain-containing protein n=1 Tax=Brevundimonas alba TaxID=74314 RepID=A0A7X6BQ90_9CAUL|nr:hypothetical protein [Brevundimonas alba]NJC42754.1 hypothetical protein [Brevundimonas alba]